MKTHTQPALSNQSGFALILALLALFLLTVLGLTLATTTTTETQIAANYRYGKQALYNAEAGMQSARYLLAQWAKKRELDTVLPTYRPGAWAEGLAVTPASVTLPDASLGKLGDYYPEIPGPACDSRAAVGYGRVLLEFGGANVPMREVTDWNGQALQGAFTIWVRRPIKVKDDGTYQDVPTTDSLVVVTVMGTAPYVGRLVSTAQNQAVRIVEQTLQLTQKDSKPCGSGVYQSGRDQLGTNFNPCGTLDGPNIKG